MTERPNTKLTYSEAWENLPWSDKHPLLRAGITSCEAFIAAIKQCGLVVGSDKDTWDFPYANPNSPSLSNVGRVRWHRYIAMLESTGFDWKRYVVKKFFGTERYDVPHVDDDESVREQRGVVIERVEFADNEFTYVEELTMVKLTFENGHQGNRRSDHYLVLDIEDGLSVPALALLWREQDSAFIAACGFTPEELDYMSLVGIEDLEDMFPSIFSTRITRREDTHHD